MGPPKRKQPEPNTATASRTEAAPSAPDPLAIYFDADAPPEAPKWGSDPDALKGKSSEFLVSLINTKNPTTGQTSSNCQVLYCLPFAMNAKQDEITAAVNKVAFGGSCSAVVPLLTSPSHATMLTISRARPVAEKDPAAERAALDREVTQRHP